ncbi:MAG TPA: ABC transporter permease [Terracidiphilus sp.]|jgi:predicted permease|nr:ABC transporter permease [Terracidiphilus sp.]
MSLQSIARQNLHQLRSWFRATLRRGSLEERMDAELTCHLELLTEDLKRSGMPEEEAAREARIALGPLLKHKEEMRGSLGLRWLDECAADLRYAVRLLRKSPGFTAIAAGSLALAIGANATLFAVGRQILFGRLTVPHPEQLRELMWIADSKFPGFSGWGQWFAAPNGGTIAPIFSYPAYQQLRKTNRELGDLVAFAEDNMNATVHGNAQRADVEMVSGNFYEQMQVRVQIGRPLEPSDDAQPGHGEVAVISDGLWQREYGRSPSVLGQVVRINQQPMTIIGVNPRGFTGVKGAMSSPDVFVPITMQPAIDPKGPMNMLTDAKFWWVNIVARTLPGIADQTAQAALATRYETMQRASTKLNAGETVPKLLLQDGSRGPQGNNGFFSKPIYVLFAFTVLLLFLACVNVANLLLARGAQRQREISVRMAMGARRRRIVRQLFTESLLLAALGGAAGIALGFAGRNLLPSLMNNPWEHNEAVIPFDWGVLGFALFVTFATATIFGLLPAWLSARNEVGGQLKESSHQVTRRRKLRASNSIVALQIALSTVLVIGAGIFLRTVMRLNSVDLGFQPDHVLMFDVDPPKTRYANGKDVLLHEQLEQKIAALPGVEAEAPASLALAGGGMGNADFVIEDGSNNGEKSTQENTNLVGNDYFHTMQIPMLAGRAFDKHDTASSPRVGVINAALARARFPNVNPVGKRFRTSGPVDQWIQIIGICADTRYAQLREEPPPVFYLPYVQQTEIGGLTYEIRTHLPAAKLTPDLHRIVQDLDRDLPMIDVRTEREQIDASMTMERALAALTTSFGILALALACVGVYGIMAYSVAQRTNEIGIRLALGALPGQIRAMILRESTWITAAGLVAGLAGGLALVPLVKSMLYGIAPYDPVSLGAAVALLLGAALAASWIPARRAARVDPMRALRHE